jgi:hypothetical protein
VIVVVFVGQVVAEADGVHPGPCHCAVFVMLDVADGFTVTSKATATADPAATPGPMVQVISDPDTATVHVGVVDDDSRPHVGEPATSDVPAGTVSVSTNGAAEVEEPTLVASSRYPTGCACPGWTTATVACLMTENAAGASTVVVTELVLQLVALPLGVQPSPTHVPTLVTVPFVVAGTETAKLRVNDWPPVTPGDTVHVITSPLTLTWHVGVVLLARLPQDGDPGTSTVPVGTASVTTSGSVDVEIPWFCTSNV